MKKIIVFLVVVLMMQTTGFAEKVGFEALIYPKEDVSFPSEWAEESVKNAEKFEITDENKEYDYTSSISREEFCNLVYNTIKAVTKTDIPAGKNKFTDTKNEKIVALAELGVINGKSETQFAPDDNLTREEAATIIVRMINKVKPMEVTEMWFEYDDIKEVSNWASDAVQTISNLGFMNGVGGNKFAPKDTYTTEQAIATLVRVCNAYEEGGE